MRNDDVCTIWQGQGPGPVAPTLEQLRRQDGKFHSQVAWRNVREYLAVALLLPYFGYCAWTTHSPMLRAGYGTMITGLLCMAYQLHRKAAAAARRGRSPLRANRRRLES